MKSSIKYQISNANCTAPHIKKYIMTQTHATQIHKNNTNSNEYILYTSPKTINYNGVIYGIILNSYTYQ